MCDGGDIQDLVWDINGKWKSSRSYMYCLLGCGRGGGLRFGM